MTLKEITRGLKTGARNALGLYLALFMAPIQVGVAFVRREDMSKFWHLERR